MKNPSFIFLFIAFTTIIVSCKKEKTAEDELAKLPLATQTGENTFGCLVNGKAWVAQTDCYFICDPSFKIYYDGEYGGNILITGILVDTKASINQNIVIGIDSTNFKTEFDYSKKPNKIGFIYMDNNLQNECYQISSEDSNTITTGSIFLTKYDLQSGIISGTFEFTLTKSGCDTIKVTNGRFDKKL